MSNLGALKICIQKELDNAGSCMSTEKANKNGSVAVGEKKI